MTRKALYLGPGTPSSTTASVWVRANPNALAQQFRSQQRFDIGRSGGMPRHAKRSKRQAPNRNAKTQQAASGAAPFQDFLAQITGRRGQRARMALRSAVQLNPGPGSALRPGAMCSCPTASTTG